MLVRLLKKECKVYEMEELPAHPNSVFVRDTAIVTPCGYIKGEDEIGKQKGEEEWMASFLKSLGMEK